MSFADSIRRWSKKADDRATAAYRTSVDMLAEQMQSTIKEGGNVPADTGNLARSLRASTTQVLQGKKDEKYTGQDVGIVTATLTASTPVWIGYQAVYARRMNYGFVGADAKGRVYNQSGHHFVEKALASWPSIVDRAAKKVKVE